MHLGLGFGTCALGSGCHVPLKHGHGVRVQLLAVAIARTCSAFADALLLVDFAAQQFHFVSLPVTVGCCLVLCAGCVVCWLLLAWCFVLAQDKATS